ncbi:hypothetical protein [Mucilaginibacter dorajii]|uniref:DUF3592 domain-containing protein n=1 Tax=Mucilaginibacter dorajii TaxID=692994 RepID=A0ABP7P8U1_9SPHI|nr:hypothetical protein [Mucilaginibacter dorajii]MCS3736594.1 hypothetical protein [Mucilaginibacter dorajii]
MKRIQNAFWITLGIAIIGCLVYKIAKNSFTEHFLGDTPQHIKAIIIDEKNFMGNQPVNPKFSYSYQFVIKGQKYIGNAHDTTLKIGDSVEVEYNKDHPGINKPLHPKE